MCKKTAKNVRKLFSVFVFVFIPRLHIYRKRANIIPCGRSPRKADTTARQYVPCSKQTEKRLFTKIPQTEVCGIMRILCRLKVRRRRAPFCGPSRVILYFKG